MDASFSPCGLDSMGELNSQLSTAMCAARRDVPPLLLLNARKSSTLLDLAAYAVAVIGVDLDFFFYDLKDHFSLRPSMGSG